MGVSASPGCSFPLGVEVDGGDGEAEVVLSGEIAGAEVVSGGRWVHGLSSLLLEQRKHKTVDPNIRPWDLIAHHFRTYCYMIMQKREKCQTSDNFHKTLNS